MSIFDRVTVNDKPLRCIEHSKMYVVFLLLLQSTHVRWCGRLHYGNMYLFILFYFIYVSFVRDQNDRKLNNLVSASFTQMKWNCLAATQRHVVVVTCDIRSV